MTPHASRATLRAAQLLCCLKVTMLVSKLRLVHQCDSSSWAKHLGLRLASVLQAASTRDESTYPAALEASTARRRAVNLLPGGLLSIKVCICSQAD